MLPMPTDVREHPGAAIISSISRRLPYRRWQTAHWLGKLIGPKGPFIGRFKTGRIEVRPDDFASMQAFYLGFFEREVTMLCVEEIRRSVPSLVVDVGANFGYYPLLFGLLSNGNTKVIAFEPDPANLARLERNVALNPELDVTIVPMAVGDRTEPQVTFGAARRGETVWSRMGDVSGGGDHGWQPVIVPMTSLDAYLDSAGIETVPITLIDVEGYEGKTIEGMKRGLSAHRYEKIMVEFHPWAFESPADVERAAMNIIDAGYKGFRIHHHSAASPDKSRAYYRTRFDESILQPLTFDKLSVWEHFWFEADGAIE
jgi:FkbM family methyltransferase